MADSIEREVKLSAAPGFHLPDLNGVAEGVTVTPVQEGRIETTYHDTPDLRLARWGCSLRFRQGEGWTLKLPDSADARMLSRRELTFPGGRRQVPAEARALVRAYLRRADPVPVARLSTWRRKLRLLDASGAELAEVVDDEVSVLDGRRVAARFREVEVELRDGGERVLEPLLARLAEAGATAGKPTPKHVRALGPAALEPPEVRVRAPGPDATIDEAIRAAVAACVEALLQHDPGIRVGGDPEDVHQGRVGMRRLRSHLRFFGPLLDPEWASELDTELQWLAGELGTVRDAEVLADRLRDEVILLPIVDRAAGMGLVDRAASAIGAGRAHLLQAMDSERYLELIDRLILAAREPLLAVNPDQPAAGVLPGLALDPWAKLRKAVSRLGRHPEDESLHRIRILTKRSRYAAEASAPVLGSDAARFAKAAAQLQTVLGELQDSAVAQAWLRANATAARRAFAAGRLCQLEEVRTQRARDGWQKPWKRLSAPKMRGWMD